MIKSHSEDPDVEQAAQEAFAILNEVLGSLPKANIFDYGGHDLRLDEYGSCVDCTTPIAEAQAAEKALLERTEIAENETIREHLELAAKLFHSDAEAALMRAELHNGLGTEEILNRILGFEYERHIGDDYHHSHHGGQS
jgi:hypothetical protein